MALTFGLAAWKSQGLFLYFEHRDPPYPRQLRKPPAGWPGVLV